MDGRQDRHRRGGLARRFRKKRYMKIGIPSEIKPDEYRVGLTPGGVREYVPTGHLVAVPWARVWGTPLSSPQKPLPETAVYPGRTA
jgi:hypothetical protein